MTPPRRVKLQVGGTITPGTEAQRLIGQVEVLRREAVELRREVVRLYLLGHALGFTIAAVALTWLTALPLVARIAVSVAGVITWAALGVAAGRSLRRAGFHR